MNDSFGHAAGDAYIINACKIICSVYDNFPVFRIGGDEFSVIFNETPREDILELEQRLQHAIEDFNRTSSFPLGIAFGYSYYDKNKDRNLEDVFRRADESMYENKMNQKNAPAGQPLSLKKMENSFEFSTFLCLYRWH